MSDDLNENCRKAERNIKIAIVLVCIAIINVTIALIRTLP